MYTIIMSDDKSLITTVKTVLYQREKLVDKIRFLFPQTYENITLSDCIVVLKYIDPGNVAHSDVLVKEDELYKGRLSYIFPIDTKLTAFAGNIKIRVSFLTLNTENGLHEEVLHTGETIITINPLSDYYTFCGDDALEILDKAMLQVESRLEAFEIISEEYNNSKADNISLDSDKIYLTSNGNKIGNEISLNDLGNAISDASDEGLIRVITEDEITIPDDGDGTTIKYTLQLDQETDELHLLMNGKIVSVIKTKDIGESIIDSTDEGLNEVII